MTPIIFFVFVVLTTCCVQRICGISGGFYADNGLQQSILYKALGRHDRDELQQEILHLLGLQHRPKPRQHDVHSSASRYLLDLYNTLEKDDSNKSGKGRSSTKIRRVLADSDFIMSFGNKAHHMYPHLRHERLRRFWFDVSKVPVEEELVYAELRIFRNASKRSANPIHKNLKFNIFSLTEEGAQESSLKLVDEKSITNQVKGWIAFNVTQAFTHWIAFPKSNLGLYMKIKSLDSEMHYVDPHEAGIMYSKRFQPILVAYFKTMNNRIRVRRAARKKNQETYYDEDVYNPYTSYNGRDRYIARRNCQRWTLYVSFKDLGWEDWIIAPDGYGAFYCQGECSFPLNAHMNATNHAIVQTLVHLMDPSVVPKPCCAPTHLTAITVLYFDDNSNVILKKYKNMVVKSCGCH